MASTDRSSSPGTSTVAPDRADELARALSRLFFSFRKWNFAKWNKGTGSVIRLYLLERIATASEPRRMSDLAESLGVSGRMITSLVDSLEAEELVRRRVDPSDRRATLVELTGSVEEARAPLAKYNLDTGMLFAGLSREDQEAFLRISAFLVGRAGEDTEAPEQGQDGDGR